MTATATMAPAARAALAGVVLRAAGSLGDMWVQTEHQSSVKGAYDDEPVIVKDPETGAILEKYGTADGVRACAASGVTHYIADRRRPLKRLATKVNKSGFYAQLAPVCGPFELDQAYHRTVEGFLAILAGRD